MSEENRPENEPVLNEKGQEQEAEKMAPNNENVDMLSEEDAAKVKFTKGDDTKVDLGNENGGAVVAAPDQYPAMTKQELMKYANDPFWVKLRWFLFAGFWLIWLGMLVAAVVIIVFAPKCYAPAPKQWWQKAPVYEVYAKSFKDSDGNGVGDIKGISSKVDYLAALGIGSVWISPIYKSPMKDNGYDISDYQAIDSTFGSLQDFKDLLASLHDQGIKVVMDFVPNHSSDQHEWFQKSIKKEEPYTDYYVWKAGSPGSPPTNWKSVFGGSAWEYNRERGEWYLHQFMKEQPDLNLRNPKVVEEMKNVLRFWLDLGVDGFRIDSVAHFFEDESLTNEQVLKPGNSYDSVARKFTYNLPECLDLLKTFREVLDAKTAEDEYNPRIMMTEAYLDLDELTKYYGTNFTEHAGDISHLPLNLDFVTQLVSKDLTASNVESTINNYLSALPDGGAWPSFNLANHDQKRPATRFGREMVDALNMVTMVLPGTPISYYGDEIGMSDLRMSGSGDKRNPARTPMQWDTSANAGFTSGTPWLPVNTNFNEGINVADQEKDGAVIKHLEVYKKLTKLRHSQSVLFGSMDTLVQGDVLMISRVRKGSPGYLLAVNFGDAAVNTNVTANALPNLGEKGTVEIHSRGFAQLSAAQKPVSDGGDDAEGDVEEEIIGSTIFFDDIPLEPKESLLINYVPNF